MEKQRVQKKKEWKEKKTMSEKENDENSGVRGINPEFNVEQNSRPIMDITYGYYSKGAMENVSPSVVYTTSSKACVKSSHNIPPPTPSCLLSYM